MATAEENIDLIIANAIALSNEYSTLAKDGADAVSDAADGAYIPPPDVTVDNTITAVEPDIPAIADSTLTYEAQLDKLVALLSDELADFYSTYYPLASDAFDEATTWLINSITVGGTGISSTVEDGIWQRDRDRVIADGRRVQAQIEGSAESRGLVLPAGATTAEVRQSLFEQAANNGITSNKIATVQAEMEVANIRFAVEQAINSRMTAMNAAGDYIRAIAMAPDAAAKVAALNTDVQASMMNATSNLYRARLSRDEIVINSSLMNVNKDVDIWGKIKDNQPRNVGNKVQAAASAAEVYGRGVSASLTSLTAIAGTNTNSFS